MHWYLHVLKSYVKFSGRARRKEYWMFQLVHVGVMFLLLFLEATLLGEEITLLPFGLYFLATLIPSIAVTVRRLHDIGLSGIWFLISVVPYLGSLVLLVLTLLNGQPGHNAYGPNPKAPTYDPVSVFT